MADIRLLEPGIEKVEGKRTNFGWSRESLSKQVNVSRATVERLCAGKTVQPKNAVKILNALQLKLDDLEIGKDYERVKRSKDDKRINESNKQEKPSFSQNFRDRYNDNYSPDSEELSNDLERLEYTANIEAVHPKESYINIDSILALQSHGLIIEERELFSSPRSIQNNHRIFWPIVPSNNSPNLIHAVFVRYLRYLVKSGLSLVIFIFDEYYEALQRSHKGQYKKLIDHFVDVLINMGLQGIDYQIIYQSNINESEQSINLISTMLTYFASITQDEFGQFSKPNQHELERSSLLRFLKPVFNMLYLHLTGDQYGFILAGFDEQPHWSTYQRIAQKQGSINPVKLYIPIMYGCEGNQTNVMDRTQNISTSDSDDMLLEKCLVALKIGAKNNPIFYVLKYVYFAEGKVISVIDTKTPEEIIINNLDDLLKITSETQDEIETKKIAKGIIKALKCIINGQIYLSTKDSR